MYQYVHYCPVHSYHWDSWTEMGHIYVPIYMHVYYCLSCPYHWDTWIEIGCTYVPIYNMHVTTVPSIRTIGTLEYIRMYRYTCMLPLGVPSIHTNETLGQDKPMYQYTCMFTTVCPVHSYYWDTWTEMVRTYVPIYNVMHVTTVPSIRTLGHKWEVPMYQHTCM